MAAKKTTAAAAQVTVKITVNANADKVYVVGNTENLGAWDAKNAVALKAVDGKFEVSKKFDANAVVEFKVLAAKDWEAVENHTFTATKGLVVEIGVDHFAK